MPKSTTYQDNSDVWLKSKVAKEKNQCFDFTVKTINLSITVTELSVNDYVRVRKIGNNK